MKRHGVVDAGFDAALAEEIPQSVPLTSANDKQVKVAFAFRGKSGGVNGRLPQALGIGSGMECLPQFELSRCRIRREAKIQEPPGNQLYAR